MVPMSRELVGHTALVDDIENARDVGAEAFALAMGGMANSRRIIVDSDDSYRRL